MADAAPSPLPSPFPQTRPRRSREKPKVTYRRSPGAVSRPVPRSIPGAGTAGRVLSGLARFIPFRAFADLFFLGVQRNAEQLAASERVGIDYLNARATARLAHGRGEPRRGRVTASRPEYATPVLPEVLVGRAAANDRVAPKPVPLPDPVLAAIELSSVASPNFSAELGNLSASRVSSPTPAGLLKPLSVSPKLLEVPLLPQFFTRFSTPVENPLLTTFNAPGVASSPLARPELLTEPLPEPDAQRCRCRARKRKAGKPGKGFFTINRRGEERRQYWR